MRLRLILCVLALFQAAAAATKPEQDKEYFAIFMEGSKIGHAVFTRKVEDGKVVSSMDMKFTFSRMGAVLEVRTSESATETADGKPLAFKVHQDLGIMASTIEGKIDANGKLVVTTTSAGQESEREMDWPEGAMLSEGARLYQLEKGIKQGTKYKLTLFEPSMLSALEATIEVGEKKKVDLLGRVVELTEIMSKVNVPPAGLIASTSYVDKNMDTLKSITPMLGMTVEIVQCPKEVALSKVQPAEFLDRFILRSPTPLGNVGDAEAVTYHLEPTAQAKLGIPETDNQKVTVRDDGTLIVTVRPVAPAEGVKFPYKGKDKTALEALKPSRFVESDNEKVVALARKAVGDAKDAAEAVRRIEKFVRDYILKKSLSVGYASAAEVVDGREGDCSEHAVLAAALCRAVGIPAEVVCGVAYVEGFGDLKHIFGPHAWVRAYVGDKWIGLDAAFPDGYDAGHITLATGNGDPEGFFGMINSLGQFEIKKATVEQ